MSDSRKLQTYVTNKSGQSFFISTALRETDQLDYWETLAFEWSPTTKETGMLRYTATGGLPYDQHNCVAHAFFAADSEKDDQ